MMTFRVTVVKSYMETNSLENYSYELYAESDRSS